MYICFFPCVSKWAYTSSFWLNCSTHFNCFYCVFVRRLLNIGLFMFLTLNQYFSLCFFTPSVCSVSNRLTGQKKGAQAAAGAGFYNTIDRRKAAEMGPQYDEIPYGDVAPIQFTQPPPQQQQQQQQQQTGNNSGKGQLPDVPAEYSQVPQIPARQGERSICRLKGLLRRRRTERMRISPYKTAHQSLDRCHSSTTETPTSSSLSCSSSSACLWTSSGSLPSSWSSANFFNIVRRNNLSLWLSTLLCLQLSVNLFNCLLSTLAIPLFFSLRKIN